MIGKGKILLRVQDFQKGGGGVAVVGRVNLVNLIQHKNRIFFTGLSQLLNNPSGKSTHIGPPMTPDFSFIPDTAQGNADKFPAKGPGNGPAKGSFSRARRA